MQASSAFGQRVVDFVGAMPDGEVLALPLVGVTHTLIWATAIIRVLSWSGQMGRVYRPALEDIRAVAEAHCRLNLLGSPAICVLRSTLDTFLDTWALAEPHGPAGEAAGELDTADIDVATHLMSIVQTAEHRRSVYDEAVHSALTIRVQQLLPITAEMQAIMPAVDLAAQVEVEETEGVLITDLYTEVGEHVTAVLDALQGMQLTRYRFKTLLHELVTNVLLVAMRGFFDRLAWSYLQGRMTLPRVTGLVRDIQMHHNALMGVVVTRLRQHCSDANVFVKHNPAPVGDDATYQGAEVDARLHEARTNAAQLFEAFNGVLELAFNNGPVVFAAGDAAAAAEVHHFLGVMGVMGAMEEEEPAMAPEDVAVAVDGIMELATVVHLLEEEDCAVCIAPSDAMVLCHGCQRAHCCVGCTRQIVQTNLLGHRCPTCRSRAFPAPLADDQ